MPLPEVGYMIGRCPYCGRPTDGQCPCTDNLLWAMTMNAGCFEVEWDGERTFQSATWRKGFDLLLRAARHRDVALRVSAAPRAERDSFSIGASGCLWVRTESGVSLDALRRFRPLPTIVLQDGETCRRTAFWALIEPLSFDACLRANKRLAHRMQAKKLHAHPGFLYTPPGCKAGAQTVRLAYRSDELYAPEQVVGGLEDAPAVRIPEPVAA